MLSGMLADRFGWRRSLSTTRSFGSRPLTKFPPFQWSRAQIHFRKAAEDWCWYKIGGKVGSRLLCRSEGGLVRGTDFASIDVVANEDLGPNGPQPAGHSFERASVCDRPTLGKDSGIASERRSRPPLTAEGNRASQFHRTRMSKAYAQAINGPACKSARGASEPKQAMTVFDR